MKTFKAQYPVVPKIPLALLVTLLNLSRDQIQTNGDNGLQNTHLFSINV